MTAPRVCEHCGAALDAGEVCDCRDEDDIHDEKEKEKRLAS